jgi:hypothetical protein
MSRPALALRFLLRMKAPKGMLAAIEPSYPFRMI